MISGFFTGLAGGLYALFMRMVPITAVELFTSTDFIIMSLLGGLGSLYGPIAGAVIIGALSGLLRGDGNMDIVVLCFLLAPVVLGTTAYYLGERRKK